MRGCFQLTRTGPRFARGADSMGGSKAVGERRAFELGFL